MVNLAPEFAPSAGVMTVNLVASPWVKVNAREVVEWLGATELESAVLVTVNVSITNR